MKASSIISVLKAARSRMEVSGVAQLGYYEFMAINIAASELKNESLRLLSIGVAASVFRRSVCLLPANNATVELLKKAYKHFKDTPPEQDFKVQQLSEKFSTEEPLPNEVLAFADNDWLKSQIEGIDKEINETTGKHTKQQLETDKN